MYGVQSTFGRHFCGVENYCCGVLAAVLAPVQGPADLIEKRAAGGGEAVHIGELALHQLELSNGLVKLLAFVDVGHGNVQAGLHNADRPPGQDGALVVQARHQNCNTFVEFPEDVLGRDFAVLEYQLAGIRAAHAQLVQFLGPGKAGEIPLDNKSGNASAAGLRISLGIDDVNMGVGSVGDPELVAVQDELIALLLCPKSHADDIRAGPGLGHGQGANMLPGAQFRQIAFPLGR